MLRRGLVALIAACTLVLAGCSGAQTSVVADSVLTVGLDVPYAGAGPASPDSTAADLAVGAATLAGFSYADESGSSVPDPGFGTTEVLSHDPLVVRYTVLDGLAWSDGVGIDGVDLLLDWAARAHPFAGVRFGSLEDRAISSADSIELSDDRKSVTIAFSDARAGWNEAFRAPLPAHAVAARAFGSPSPERAKDDVIAAIDAARAGDLDALSALAAAWSKTFAIGSPPPPASGPYRLATAGEDAVELAVNQGYSGPRHPAYARLVIRALLDPAAAIQALSIGELDLVQVSWNETLWGALLRVGADRIALPTTIAPELMVGWYHRALEGVQPAPSAVGALWNPWAWSPFLLTDD